MEGRKDRERERENIGVNPEVGGVATPDFEAGVVGSP